MVFSKEIDIKILFTRIASNDEQAYKQLYDACHQTLFAVAYFYGKNREFANDVVHDVFLKVWERRKELNLIENPEGWLTNAARFQMLNSLKKELTKENYLTSVITETFDASPEQLLINQEKLQVVNSIITSLPARQQQVYKLSREEGLTYKEIGERLQIAHETVKEHVARL